MPAPAPNVYALLLAERVIEDSASRVFSVVNVLTAVGLNTVPESFEQLWFYVALSGVRPGTLRLELSYINSPHTPIQVVPHQVSGEDPLKVQQFRGVFKLFTIDRVEDLVLRLTWNGQEVCDRRIVVYPPGVTPNPF